MSLFFLIWKWKAIDLLSRLEVKDTPECSEPHTRSKFTFSGSGGVADVGQAEYCYPKDLVLKLVSFSRIFFFFYKRPSTYRRTSTTTTT